MRLRYKKSAFSMIEAMVVVVIIALLAILAIGVFTRQLAKGRDARRKADMNRIVIAIEESEKVSSCYPTQVTCTNPGSLQPYLKSIPCDPKKVPYAYEPEPVTCPSWFRLYTNLEFKADPKIKTGIGPGGAYNFSIGSTNAQLP